MNKMRATSLENGVTVVAHFGRAFFVDFFIKKEGLRPSVAIYLIAVILHYIDYIVNTFMFYAFLLQIRNVGFAQPNDRDQQ